MAGLILIWGIVTYGDMIIVTFSCDAGTYSGSPAGKSMAFLGK